MKTLRVQIPYKKYGVIELNTELASATTDEQAIAYAKQLIDKHSNVEADVKVSEFVKPNEKQLGLIKRMGGDVNKQFKNWDSFSQYIEELKAKNPQGSNLQSPRQYQQAPAPVADNTPWDNTIL